MANESDGCLEEGMGGLKEDGCLEEVRGDG